MNYQPVPQSLDEPRPMAPEHRPDPDAERRYAELMREGYREMAEEDGWFAESTFALAAEVVVRR